MSEEKVQIFCDSSIEERYGEELYQDYLEKQNKDLQQRVDKAIEYLNEATIDQSSMLHYRNCLLEILKGNK